MADFTPGPWTADTSKRHVCAIWADWHGEKDDIIATTHWVTNVRGDPVDYEGENVANARLIAASPALYEVLVDLLERVDGLNELAGEYDADPIPMALVSRARKVLAQARGETEGG